MPCEGSGPNKATVADGDVLAEVIRCIVATAQPDRIVFFGSATRGEMRRDGDIDFLGVKLAPVHRGRLAEAIYINLVGVGQAVDIVVVTPEDIEQYGDAFCLVIEPALREGRIVYEGEAATAG